MLSHYNLTSVLAQTRVSWTYYEHGRDVAIVVLPFFHVYGAVILVLALYRGGIPFVVLPRFEPVQFLQCMERYKVTVCSRALSQHARR